MGLFKRKIKTEELETEVEIEFTAEELKYINKLEMLKSRLESLESYLRLGIITQRQFIEEKNEIEKEIDSLDPHRKAFDEMMDYPLDFLNDLFNTAVHKAIDEVEDESI